MFLADAVAAYVESLSERELDAPLLALLHRLGFHHVHLVHGSSEYGKDFIARLEEDGITYQYCLQSKAGDLGIGGWREVRLQVDEMRTGTVVHPDFDPSLPRRLVVVTNGRLVGTAGVAFQDYNSHHRTRGETTADFWGSDFLVPKFESILVEGVPAVDRARTLELLGRLGQGQGSRQDLSRYARAWFQAGVGRTERWGHVLTAAMLAKEAAAQGREDLAAQISYLLLRAAWENPLVPGSPDVDELSIARRIFTAHATQFWDVVKRTDPMELTTQSRTGLELFVTHPVKVARLCEQLSMLGLLAHTQGDERLAEDIAAYVERLTSSSPGVAHPVSDEWGFSLLVSVLFLVRCDRRSAASKTLREAAVWLLDRLESGKGIARPGEPADAAVRQLLGPAYPHVQLGHEPSAYSIAVVLDLAFLCGFQDLYRNLLHDLDAVGGMANIVVPNATGDAELVARVAYSLEEIPPAVHHSVPVDSTAAGAAGAYFDCLATWATMRDRHLPAVLTAMLTV